MDRVYTDHGVFAITADGVQVVETFRTTVEELAGRLDVPLTRRT